jgi:hypothetical protein
MSSNSSQSTVLKSRDVPSLTQDKYETVPADAIAFLKEQTGITADEELKNHVYAIQAKAYQVNRFFYLACSHSSRIYPALSLWDHREAVLPKAR